MRKLFCIVSAAAIALGQASCNKEPVETAGHQITLVANTEGCVDTKTSLSGNDQNGYQVLWSEGDKIILADGWDTEFTLSEGAGTARGTFVGTSPEGDGDYPVYYATNGKMLLGNSQYTTGGVISSAPMAAIVSIRDGVASLTDFKNLCGMLRLTIKGSGSVKEIKVYANEPLNGRIDIDWSGDCHATVEESDIDGKYVNTLYCGDGVEITEEGTVFYISMPQNNYSGVRIAVKDNSGSLTTKTLKADKRLNITRSQITPVSLTVTKPKLPEGALSGPFTVSSSGRRIFFSRGNLYWDGDSFEFETEQYNYPEKRLNNHIGHFFWSRTASGSLKESDYSSEHNLFTNHPDNAYLAKADFVVNGVKGRYRTLNLDEWEYLFANHEHSFAEAEGVKGIVIAPDGVSLTANKESYTKAELNDNNLVFLPAAGIWQTWPYREIVDCEQHVYYLSSNANHYHSYYNNSGSGIWFSYEQKRLVSTTQYSELANPPLAWGHPIRLVTAMSDDEPLDSSDIEKPEEGNTYDWE